MAIKNKDGSILRLSKPNPLMVEQSLWEDSPGKYTLHNCKWESVAVGVPVVALRPEVKEPPADHDAKSQELEPAVGPANIVQIWCLPAALVETVDPLYDEKHQSLRYGDKFLFEAVLRDQGDLSLVLWTTTAAVTLGSVLYPRTKDKRWWRVQSRGEADGGYVLGATMSDFQPDFS